MPIFFIKLLNLSMLRYPTVQKFGVSNANTFIPQKCIKLIEMDSEDLYIITKNLLKSVFNFD